MRREAGEAAAQLPEGGAQRSPRIFQKDAYSAHFHYDREVDEKPIAESADQAIGDNAESSPPSRSTEPPKIYIAACGTLCDIFWWARRTNQPE